MYTISHLILSFYLAKNNDASTFIYHDHDSGCTIKMTKGIAMLCYAGHYSDYYNFHLLVDQKDIRASKQII